MEWMYWVGGVLALLVGVWIGVGAPGWPHKADGRRRHREKRPLNPIQWGHTRHRTRRH